MSQKIDRLEPDIGVRAIHSKYGDVEIFDKIKSVTNSLWVVLDTEDELHIADESNMSDYYNY